MPTAIREGVTDFLTVAVETTNVYEPVRERLAKAIADSQAGQVVDLCSGAGGPWPNWRRKGLIDCAVTLTDKFPSAAAQQRLAASPAPEVCYLPEPVDASAVPKSLEGFRTLFTSFHHFRPDEARSILQDAVRSRQPVGIFETTHRNLRAMASMIGTPVAVWLLTPRIPHLSWKVILFTYLIPIIPLIVLLDGWTSCLRSYKPDELRAMADQPGYAWTCGTEHRGWWWPPATYLIGIPLPQGPSA